MIREDPKNKDLLYVGTEFGLFVSLDGGKAWQKFMNNYPTVRTDDILVHPRDNDLIVATHGRSVWIADDITPLQQLTQAVRDADATLFDIRPAVAWLNDQQHNQQVGGQKNFIGENAPRGAAINYYLKSAAGGDVKISIADVNGRVIRTLDGPKTAGINRVMWNLAPAPPAGQAAGGFGGGGGGGRGGGGAVEPGTYIVTPGSAKVPQGSAFLYCWSNIYLNEVDKMLEKAKETTREGKYTHVEYARFADDVVILVDGHHKWDWLWAGINKRLREELDKLQVHINEEKTRQLDLIKGDSFGFLGFDFRRLKTKTGKWRVNYQPKMQASFLLPNCISLAIGIFL